MNFTRWILMIVVINIAFVLGFYLAAPIFIAADLGYIIIVYSAIIAAFQIILTVFRNTETFNLPSQPTASVNDWLPRATTIVFILTFSLFIYLKFQSAITPNRYLIIIGALAINLISNLQLWHMKNKKTSGLF